MFESLFQIFSNREISILIWSLLLVGILLFFRSIRLSFIPVILAFLKLYKWYVAMLFYIAGLVFLFYKIELWDFSLIKNTVYWILGNVFILFFNVDKALKKEKHFYKVYKDCFKLIIIVEFLSNLYSFNLAIELISIPILAITGLLVAFSEDNPEYKSVNKLFNGLIMVYGLFVIVFSFIKVSSNINTLFTIENLQSLLFGSIMTLSLIPFLYFLALFMGYESFLTVKKFILKDNINLYRFLKWKVLQTCHISLKRLRLVDSKLHVYTSIQKEQIKSELHTILIAND